MITKIKHKLFFSFLLFSSFSLMAILVSLWLNDQKDDIAKELNTLDEVYILALKDFKIQQEFLTYETINPMYFKTGRSVKLSQHAAITAMILNKIAALQLSGKTEKLFTRSFLQKCKYEFLSYQNTFQHVAARLLVRGFKDYGVEGEMRDYAHALMDVKELDQVNVLMLRRHEKDFIIRKENEYAIKFNAVIEKVKNEIHHGHIPSSKIERVDSIVNGYSQAFAKLVKCEHELGLKQNAGLMLKLTEHNNTIESLIDQQKNDALVSEKRIFKELLFTAVFIFICICVLSFSLSYWVAGALTKPLIRLNNYIKEYVSSNFTNLPLYPPRNSKDEISILMNNFYCMAGEIKSHIKYFKEKVEQRTLEINNQKIEILNQQKQIIEQRDELIIKTQTLEFQQKLMVDKNENILDSIRYAERIQQAILPSKKVIKKNLPDSFVYYQPRNIVSGDFYCVHQKNNKILFAVADCTGHGVPGAFVSIVAHNAITRAIKEFRLQTPAMILDKVNELIDESFSKQSDDDIRDGMDIAFCSLSFPKPGEDGNIILEYAGANNPLWIISGNEEYESGENADTLVAKEKSIFTLKEIKADKQPIGRFEQRRPFTNHTIELFPNDTVYIFSDGYADQFGGPEGKKFKYSRFKDLLLGMQQEPMERQKQLLHETIEHWKGKQEQVDDMCIMGIRI